MLYPCCLFFCEYPLLTLEFLNQSIWNLVCISWHMNPSQRRTTQIPLISLYVPKYNAPIIARQRLGNSVGNEYTQH
jgi:hypothetical protein